ncbi:hypothetical protein AMTRI_Chr02g211460 [Amborella trichopoda]
MHRRTRLLSLHYFTLTPLLKSIFNQLNNQPIKILTNHIPPINISDTKCKATGNNISESACPKIKLEG